MLKANESFDLYVNQRDREAVVLAVIDNEAIAEYEMPNGRSYLTILKLDENGEPIQTEQSIWTHNQTHWSGRDRQALQNDYIRKSVSYEACPVRWIVAMVNQGTEWLGGAHDTFKVSRNELDRCKAQMIRFRTIRDEISA